MRARIVPAVLAAVLLAGCTTTVDGSGRPGKVAAGGASPGASPSGSGTASSSGGDALDIWSKVASALDDEEWITVSGAFSGAAFGEGTDTGAPTIVGNFGRGDDGKARAQVTVTTPVGTVEVRATGGTAWANASAPLLQALGYTPEEVTAAAGKWGVLADDQKGLDVFASLDAFLQICAPDGEDDLTAEDTKTAGGQDAVILHSDLADGEVTVTTDPPLLLSSRYSGDDLQFGYEDRPLTVEAPPADQVVTVPDF